MHVINVFRGVDAVLVRVPTLERGLAFYRDQLGHQIIWRTPTSVGLGMEPATTELVLALDTGPETDILVDSVDAAVERVARAGGSVVSPPADIAVGRVAVVADPFGNELTLIDLSRGRFETDAEHQVRGVTPPA